MFRAFNPFLVLLLATLLVDVPTESAHASDPRLRLRFDADWRFHLDDFSSPKATAGVTIENWKCQFTERQDAFTVPAPLSGMEISGSDSIVVGKDVFGGQPGFAWFQTRLPSVQEPLHDEVWVLRFEGVDDCGTVYLNGKKLVRHEGYAQPFDVVLTGSAWRRSGPNELAVLVENCNGGGGIMKPVVLSLMSRNSLIPKVALPDFDDSQWRTVHLPHDYVVEEGFDPKASAGHGSLPTPKGWYRKTFAIPADWKGKRLWIDFDGIYSDAKVWFNGQYVGGCRSGYIGQRYSLEEFVRYGQTNTLAVHVDPSHEEGWWYEGGGIYRHAWINVAEPLHIEPGSLFVKSEVQGDLLDNPIATLKIQAALADHSGDSQPFVLEAEVIGPDGKRASLVCSESLKPKKEAATEVQLDTRIQKPHLWSLESPDLYQLIVTVRRNGQVIDRETVPFGIRTLRFDPNLGFFLNGKPVKIQGVCNHQDFAGIGIALPDSHHEWRVRKLKAVGCNAYRTSHNPVASEMLDACDRLGMLVLDETRHFGDTYQQKSGVTTGYEDLSDLEAMVRRDRNHPSIIAWSIANEEIHCERSKEAETIARAMKAKINALDGTRPITAAGVEHFAGYPGLSNAVDIEGFNYGPAENYDRWHKLHPDRPMLATETCSALATRGIYSMESFKHNGKEFWGDSSRGYINGYGLCPERGHPTSASWKPVAERPFVAGAFVWTGFDYRGEPHPFSWPVINSHFGFMDTCGFPKDDYFYYMAWWAGRKLVHLAPHWNWPANKGIVKVLCLGNTETVELWLNGKSLGSKPMPQFGHLEWDVPFEPGTLEARGFDAGKMVASKKVQTTGPAAGLSLASDRKEFIADSEDQIPVEVAITDESGLPMPTADNRVSFSLSGPGIIAGVGNGDPSSHEPDKAAQRQAFNGHCMVIVQATGHSGEIVLTATSPGLKPATVCLRTLPPTVKEFK